MTRVAALLAVTVAVVVCISEVHVGAEEGVLVLHVSDVSRRPIQGLQISTQGLGAVSPRTDTAGRTRIRLADKTRPQAVVGLTITGSLDLVFISPWDGQVRVPPFENESQNFVPVVLATRGDRTLLESGTALAAIAARIVARTDNADPGTLSASARAEILSRTADIYGLTTEELTAAIRAWGQKSPDRYEKGLAALVANSLADAESNLAAALAEGEERLEREQRELADRAFFYGESLYRQGKYVEAVTAYRKANALRPGDPATTNNLGLTLLQLADYAGAEQFLQLAITSIESAKGTNAPDVAYSLNNLGGLLVMKGDLQSALTVFRRGLDIRRRMLDVSDPRTANSMNNVASALLLSGQDSEAESLIREARGIYERASRAGRGAPSRPGPSQRAVVTGGGLVAPDLSAVLMNQSVLERHRGRLDEAKTLAQDVVRNKTQQLGPRHPDVAYPLSVLAENELAAKEHELARDNFRRALDIWERTFGPDHPALVTGLVGVGDASVALGDASTARDAYQRAVGIRQRVFGEKDLLAVSIGAKLTALR